MSFSGRDFLHGVIERGDPGALALIDRDAEWVVPGDARYGGGAHRGWEALVRFFRLAGELFPQGLAFEAGREWRSTEGIVVEATLSAVTAAGRGYRNAYLFVLEMEGDRVTRITEYTDTSLAERLLEVAGPAS